MKFHFCDRSERSMTFYILWMKWPHINCNDVLLLFNEDDVICAQNWIVWHHKLLLLLKIHISARISARISALKSHISARSDFIYPGQKSCILGIYMCVCICMYMYICVSVFCVCMYEYICICMWLYLCICILHVYIYVCIVMYV